MATDPAVLRHVIKRYGVTRLYDTATETYTDVDDLEALRRLGVEIIVVDAKTGEDVTGDTLGPAPPPRR